MSAGRSAGLHAKVAAIVLAAGRSSRLAPRNKLLEEIAGEPMVRRVAAMALASGTHPVIVVTGFEADKVAQALHGLDVKLVHNPAFDQGLSTSLHAGLRALPVENEGALICLADMPGIEPSVFEALLAAFAAAGPDAICVPVHNGQRGNPVLWGRDHFSDMMAIRGDSGAKPLMAEHAERVIEVPAPSACIFADVDTPQDLISLKTRLRAGA